MEGDALTTPLSPICPRLHPPLLLLCLPTRQPHCSFSFLKAAMWPLARSTTWI